MTTESGKKALIGVVICLALAAILYFGGGPTLEELFQAQLSKAVEQNSTKPCRSLPEKHLVEECMRLVNGQLQDANVCLELTLENKADRCLDDLARNTGNRNLCGRIKRDLTRIRCFDELKKTQR